MEKEMPAHQAIPTLLATQLLAAAVYSQYLSVSGDGESTLWRKMLSDELEHVDLLKRLMHRDHILSLPIPEANIHRMREVCEQVSNNSSELFLLRLEGALRLECAELDYGLEGLVSRRLDRENVIPACEWDISGHLAELLDEARRYEVSPNIGLQMRRLTDLLETSLSDTEVQVRDDTTRIL